MTRRIYSGKDFDTIKQEVKSLLERKNDNINFDYENDLTNFLVDLISYASENLSWFLDVKANESFVGLANLRDSLAELAIFSGYNPKGAVPASGEVSIRPAEEYGKNVLINEGANFSATNGLTYEATESVLWSANSTSYKSVTLSQVETQTVRFRSNGERNERFQIENIPDDQHLAYRSPTVTVDGDQWDEVDRKKDTDNTVYRISYASEPPYIEFGDNVAGNIPKEDAEIFIEYKTTSGISGNLNNAGNITAVSELVTTSDGQNVSFEFDDSTGVMSGGDDVEDLRSIRSSIPDVGMADGAVVTEDDIKAILNTYRDPNFGSIASATAYVARSISKDPESLLKINSVLGSIFDADNTVDSVISKIDEINTILSDLSNDTSTEISNIISLATSNIQGAVVSIQDQINSVLSNSTNVRINQERIRELVDEISSSYDSTTDSFANASEVKDKVTTIGSLADESNSLMSQIKSNSSTLLKESEDIYDENANADDTGFVINIDSVASDLDTIVNDEINKAKDKNDENKSTLQNDLIDPWSEGEQKIKELKNHLDTIFTDICGPNLVSVPILSYDSDEFYTSPSIGLMRSFEEYLSDKREPSIVFNVVDGSDFLISPKIEFIFRPKSTFSPTKIKSAIETEIQDLLRNSDFGNNLYLDDLYDRVRPIEGVESLNINITGFSIPIDKDESDTIKDSEGNLIVSDDEVLNRPDLSFFQKFADGTKEPI